MATKTVTLSRTVAYDSTNGVFTLKVWVSFTSYNIPPEIFLFQAMPTYTVVGFADDVFPTKRFLRTAKYADMHNYPAGSQDAESVFFRERSVYATFNTLTALSSVWDAIHVAVQALVDEIAAVHAATPTVTAVTV